MDNLREKTTLWLRQNRICTRCLNAETDGIYNNCEKCREKRSILENTGIRKFNPVRHLMRVYAKRKKICTQCFSRWAENKRFQCEHCIRINFKKRKIRERTPDGKFLPDKEVNYANI